MTTNKKSGLIITLLFILSILSFTISSDLNHKEVKETTAENIALLSLDEYTPKDENSIKFLADANTSTPVADDFCGDIQATLQIVYYILLVIRILVPLGICAMSIFDFYNAVTGGSAEALRKEAIILGKRVLIGLIIFFIPTIINIVVDAADKENEMRYRACLNCLFENNCNVKDTDNGFKTRVTTEK